MNVWWSEVIKTAAGKKEAAEEVLGVRDKAPKERCMEAYKKENGNVKSNRCIY